MTLHPESASFRRARRVLCVAAALAVTSGASWSQPRPEAPEAWPSKPVEFLVPFAAGGGTDIVARLLAAALEPLLGQPIIVENRIGAQGAIGASMVAKAPPDGYTVLVGSIGTQAVNQYLYKTLPYDPAKDFAPVTVLTKTNTVLTAASDSPFKSLAELIAYAKQNPASSTTEFRPLATRAIWRSSNPSSTRRFPRLAFRTRGFELASLPPREFSDFVAGQRTIWSKVIREANIKLEQ